MRRPPRWLEIGSLAVTLLGLGSSSHAQGPKTGQPQGGPANQAHGPGIRDPSADRVHADAFVVWIYKNPERDPAPIGYLRGGQSAALLSGEPVSRSKCSGGWYAVQPAGFVCVGSGATLEPSRYVRSMAALGPRAAPLPFDFALSMGSPAYRRIPTEAEWARKERPFGQAQPRPLPPHWQGHEELIADEPWSLGEPDLFLEDGGSVARSPENRLVRREVPFGSMLAITGAFEAHGRTFLQSADGTIVPADRMRKFSASTFQGIELGQVDLPVAWARRPLKTFAIRPTCLASVEPFPVIPPGRLQQDSPALNRDCLHERGRVSTRERLELSGRSLTVGGTRLLQLRGRETWLPSDSLFLAERREPPRTLATEAAAKPAPTWIHFRIGQGTLVAYEGARPVFATLASPGIGGMPRAGGDSLSDRTTPLGIYRIHFKHRTDDMSPEHGEHRSFWIADVPYAMYFKQPFAIHAAYWHESFGEPMSGGCINVSPSDGKWLFDWSHPRVPVDWYGVGTGRDFGPGTTVVIER